MRRVLLDPNRRTSPHFGSVVLLTAGVLATTALLSCGRRGTLSDQPVPSALLVSAQRQPVHEHTAPHGGILIELGDEIAHVELVLDRQSGTLSAFVLDGEAEQSLRVAQTSLAVVLDAPAARAGHPINLAARANVLTGETVGDSSEFVGQSDAFRGLARLRGRVLNIVVKGQAFRDAPFEGD
jgi:hypothetical protein